MKLNTMTKTLVCGASVMFLLSIGACQIKGAGVRVETDTELKAKVSRAIKRYMQENGDAPRSFDLLKGKYLDEKTYKWALAKNMKYHTSVTSHIDLACRQNQKAARPQMPRLMFTVPNIAIAIIPRATYILMFQESATSTCLGMVGKFRHHFRCTCGHSSVTM
jgi:hypothetical protein